MEKSADVAFFKVDKVEYPQVPYGPAKPYSELENMPYTVATQDSNEVYEAVRDIFMRLGFDREHYNMTTWNPLRDFVKAGGKVFIKPNQVFHEHKDGLSGIWSMVTHASILRPIIDYVLLATGGNVEIIIGEAPVQGCDFQKTTKESGLADLLDFYRERDVNIVLIDLRMVIAQRTQNGIVAKKVANFARSVDDYVTVNLGENSELAEIIGLSSRLDITDYKIGAVKKHHCGSKNEYIIARELLEADLVINVPKLKTHRKAGLTCACKNLVGIVGDKTCIAHHRRGMREGLTDEFSRKDYKIFLRTRLWEALKKTQMGLLIADVMLKIFRQYIWKGTSKVSSCPKQLDLTMTEGNWYGNDTIWRCVKDLNKIVLYANRDGVMRPTRQRKYLCIADGIWAGEGEGPMEHVCKKFGMLLGGCNPVYIDYAAAYFMKFDYRRIPTIYQGFVNPCGGIKMTDKRAEEVLVTGNREREECREHFKPSYGWKDVLYGNGS